ncbi:MAG: hydrogenase maturation protease [Candidatus Nezhaarchaeota archaeon]|nr:hydrogenase maturation protease [Candidatus Nezhaarchaeota archaeon]
MKYLIACLGNPLMGDDGVGLAVARELAKRGHEVVTCGPDLSSVLTKVDDIDLVIVVDAIDLEAEPGSVFVLKLEDVDEVPARSSHTLRATRMLKTMMRVFRKPIDAYLVGVQPERVEPATELTPRVKSAISEVVAKVEELIMRTQEKKS